MLNKSIQTAVAITGSPYADAIRTILEPFGRATKDEAEWNTDEKDEWNCGFEERAWGEPEKFEPLWHFNTTHWNLTLTHASAKYLVVHLMDRYPSNPHPLTSSFLSIEFDLERMERGQAPDYATFIFLSLVGEEALTNLLPWLKSWRALRQFQRSRYCKVPSAPVSEFISDVDRILDWMRAQG